MTKVVLPSISLSVPCCTIFSVRVSIDEVASSMISRGVSAIAARAMDKGCRYPCERLAPSDVSIVLNPSGNLVIKS